MPKKTKREKAIAEYHRKLSGFGMNIAPDQLKSLNAPQSQNPTSSFPYTYSTTVTSSVPSIAVAQPYDLSIRRDLIRTLILASIAIGGEIVLSLTIK